MLISGCRGMVLGRSAMWGAGAISGASQIAPLSSPAGAGPTHAQTRTPRGAPARPGRLAALLPRRSSFIPMSSASAGSSFPLLPAPASALTPAPAPALCGPGLPQEPPPFGAPPCRPRRAGSLPRPAASASAAASPSPPPPKPAAQGTRLSDALWPGLGAALSFCGLAAMDHALRSKRLTMSLASFAAVSSLLFAAPHAPVSQRPRVLMAHLGASLIGVAAMAVLGPTWQARCIAVGLAVSFMLLADCLHPPAAGLPVIFIDGPKHHHLGWWFPLPAFAGCLWLFLMQELILFLKEKVQF